MGAVRAEFCKLKRSLSWTVVAVLPLMAVLTGVVNTVVSGPALEQGWHTLWLRTVVFHGLFPLAAGVAVLASLLWRVEHQGGNWNALMGRSTSGFAVAAAKVVVLAVLAAAVQAVLVAGVLVVGKAVFGLPGVLPPRYLLVSAVIVVACLPVAALQSALSMLMRSFAAPVVVAVAGSTAGALVVLIGHGPLTAALPYALLTRATQLGTGVFGDDGTVTAAGVAVLVAVASALTVVVIAGTASLLERRDVH
ncbi:ABC transporter permease [Nocardiopsis sp. HNM0947]|uniref:ABC transporter permease n=1 Tax=Nocardiopsis coralli TaxID=2772213 RepID=A0ABR9PE28_9ACTN|nr:ABC transporter permease [Nocardiopsis coralli]MBE3001985.1 ABC transporter permease [Nocardiopsis coralli]